MYATNRKYGYLPHLKRPLLGGVIILSLSLSSLYAATTTKTDANGINAKANSNAVGVNGANNSTTIVNNKTVINKTVIYNYSNSKGGGHTTKETKKAPPITKTPAKPLPKTPTKATVKTVPTTKAVAHQPAKNDCLARYSKDYCNTTGKLLNKH